MFNLSSITEKDKEKIETIVVLIIIVLGILGYFLFFKNPARDTELDTPKEKTIIEKLTAPENSLSQEELERIEQIRQDYLTAPVENSGTVEVSDEVLKSLTAPE